MNETIILIIVITLLVIGIAGCILPGIPGLVVTYAGLLVHHFFAEHDYPIWLLVILGLLVVFYIILQYMLPPKITKKFGGSKYAQWGSIVGLLVGLFTSFMGPIGLFLGPFLGAVAGELLFAKEPVNKSLKAGLGAVVGMITTNFVELMFALGVVVVFIQSFF